MGSVLDEAGKLQSDFQMSLPVEKERPDGVKCELGQEKKRNTSLIRDVRKQQDGGSMDRMD